VTRWIFVVLLALLASWPAHARAEVISVSASPVIRMQMRSGSVTVRTWNKQQVQVESNAPVRARHIEAQAVENALPPEVPIFDTTIITADGPPLILPPETFALGSLVNSPHDGVLIFGGDDGADVTLTIPNSTALLLADVARGSITINGYRSGTFVALVRAGVLQLRNVGGDGYAQVARGPLVVRDSAFNRIRARTAVGNIIFENCNARQIVVSSVKGSIAYDNGTFVPGIARFDSQNGNVAIGVAGGGARIDAHSAGGRIFSGFSNGAAVTGSPTDAQAIVGPGGPVVTVNSQRGGVFLYNGTLRSRARLQGPWQPVGRILRRPLQEKLPHRGHV
jgi:hypothetical protein